MGWLTKFSFVLVVNICLGLSSEYFDCRRGGHVCLNAGVCDKKVGNCSCHHPFSEYNCGLDQGTIDHTGVGCLPRCSQYGLCSIKSTGEADCFCHSQYYGEACDKRRVETTCTEHGLNIVIAPFPMFYGLVYVLNNRTDAVCGFSVKNGKNGMKIFTANLAYDSGCSITQSSPSVNEKKYSVNVIIQNSLVFETALDINVDASCVKTVHYPPIIKELISSGQKNLVEEGSNVSIYCYVDSQPTSSVSWTRSLKKETISSQVALVIPKVTCADADNYTCTAHNGIGKPVSKTISLFVSCLPRLDQSKFDNMKYNSIVVSYGEPAIFPINVIAYPSPSFTWYRHYLTDIEQEVTDFKTRQIDTDLSSMLIIENVTAPDYGFYKVYVKNSVGIRSRLFELVPVRMRSKSP